MKQFVKVVGHISPQHLKDLEKSEIEWKRRKADRKYLNLLKKQSIQDSKGGYTETNL